MNEAFDLLRKAVEDADVRTQEWQKNHDIEAAAFRKEITESIKPLAEFYSNAKWSYKFIIILAGLIGSIAGIWVWAKDHLK